MKPFPIDHDLHCHTGLSSCSADPLQTPMMLLQHARAHGYTCQCVTDHVWDDAVPGSGGWYAPQTVEHSRGALPLPSDPRVRMVFGCETEFCGGDKLALTRFDAYDFVAIPVNHFHMVGLVRPEGCDTVAQVADLLVSRLEELAQKKLPWRKVGLAHIVCKTTFRSGPDDDVYAAVDEERFRAVMRTFAALGAGVEINLSSFAPGWQARAEDRLRLLRFAKEEGCRFYLGSDAHHPDDLSFVPDRAPAVIAALGLDESHLWRLPEPSASDVTTFETGAPRENTAVLPIAPFEDDCYSQAERHAQVLACKDAIDPEVLLVGDSITHFWGGAPVTAGAPCRGADSFARAFAGRRVLNLGYGFDRTQNVLWRFSHGELDGLHPKVAIVNIGTNNLPGTERFAKNTPQQVCEGVERVCEELEKRCPGVRILLMCLFPRDRFPDGPNRGPIAETNARLVPMAARHGWRTLDIGSLLLNVSGELSPEIAEDGTHPTAKGYAVWAGVVAPLVRAACERDAP